MYEEYLAAQEKGLKVKPVSKPPVPKTCAEALEQHLANGCRENHDVKTRIVLPKPENDEMVYDAKMDAVEDNYIRGKKYHHATDRVADEVRAFISK